MFEEVQHLFAHFGPATTVTKEESCCARSFCRTSALTPTRWPGRPTTSATWSTGCSWGDSYGFRRPTYYALGYQKHGMEVLFNGYTGRRLNARVFIVPTYYQRLKHMVDDKIHSRVRGPVVMLSRQPMEGRAREGGLR
ncbi:unnamed protein product [Vitrella brassicaformis CCMP3155]|uniref:DNA-directed RNA polymerase n=1 Tax=Vitrella brassicaformis (strain CCMP3155) TaxID=1169540 RepID=A0A0G4FZT8_VITBC|nr:unnamed protein product [Vitrella brassicaformis CCMP3155]|eukprot:CEM21158.1 unnamed protein product [Vitrella brassicaformis CCMP3155]